MRLHKLFAAFLALSVLFAPAVAYAEMPATQLHHGMQMMEMGHCQMLPAKTGDHDKADGKSCCMAMCLAMAVVAPSAPVEIADIKIEATYFAGSKSWHGYLGEIATPPPRKA
jgi:hypothetical protein